MTTRADKLVLRRLWWQSLGVIVAACGLLAGFASAADATSATATLTAGSLAFVTTPPAVSFSATLNGTDQTSTSPEALDIGDATGSGSGWNVTATSTVFTDGSDALSTAATTVHSAPTIACDSSSSCTPAVNGVTYPYTLPAGVTAPTATRLVSAAVNSGMGDQTATPVWQLAIPAGTTAGTYTSTWTFSIVSGP